MSYYVYLQNFSANYIDGQSLMILRNDIEEFRLLIPQSGLRIKIKSSIEEYSAHKDESEENVILEPEDDLLLTPPLKRKQIELTPRECNVDDIYGCSSNNFPKEIEVQGTPDATQKSQVTKTPIRAMRLPTPCPLPDNITDDLETALSDDSSKLTGVKQMRFLRRASEFYWGICPRPTPNEYVMMAITLCDKYPKLKDKKPLNGQYWVCIKACIYWI